MQQAPRTPVGQQTQQQQQQQQQPPPLPAEVDVAVVGGGPAGLAVALALTKVLPPGTSVRVFEAAPALAGPQACAPLHVHAMRALEAIHPPLVHRLYDSGAYAAGRHMYDDVTGQRLPFLTAPLDHTSLLQRHGHTPCVVSYGRLIAELHRELPEGTVHFGAELVGFQQLGSAQQASPDAPAFCEHTGQGHDGGEGSGPTHRYLLSFDRGAGVGQVARVRARVVVGADGCHSLLRRQVLGRPGAPFAGFVGWHASLSPQQLHPHAPAPTPVPWPRALDTPAKRTCLHIWIPTAQDAATRHVNPADVRTFDALVTGAGVSAAAAAAAGEAGEAGDGVATWHLQAPVGALREAGEDFPLHGVGACGCGCGGGGGGGGARGQDAVRRALRVSTHLPEDVRALIVATPPDRVAESGLFEDPAEELRPGAWYRGGVVLVGDAAHGSTRAFGDAVSNAMESAAVLAAAVRQHGLGPQAFTAYESAQQPRVRGIYYDQSPPFKTRLPLIFAAAHQPLWSPEQLLPLLPPNVAQAVQKELLEGASEPRRSAGSSGRGGGGEGGEGGEGGGSEKGGALSPGMEAVLRWSKEQVRRTVERRAGPAMQLAREISQQVAPVLAAAGAAKAP